MAPEQAPPAYESPEDAVAVLPEPEQQETGAVDDYREAMRMAYEQELQHDHEALAELEAAETVKEVQAVVRHRFENGPEPTPVQQPEHAETVPQEVFQGSPEEEVQFRLEQAINAGSLDRFLASIDEQVASLGSDGDMQRAARNVTVRSQLRIKAEMVRGALAVAGVSAANVHLYDGAPNELGHNTVGDGDANIGINRTLLLQSRSGLVALLIEVLIHESRHGVQVKNLDMGEGKFALILSEKTKVGKDETIRLLEADTDHFVEQQGRLVVEDKPPEYDRGLAAEAKQQVGRSEWDATLTGHGRVSELQQASWDERVRSGELTLQRLNYEARATGHIDEAREVVHQHADILFQDREHHLQQSVN